jgi:hypothetical protein
MMILFLGWEAWFEQGGSSSCELKLEQNKKLEQKLKS